MVRKVRNNLRALRYSNPGKRVSQLDLAVKAGITRDRYWYIENGYKEPTEDELKNLAKALKVSRAALGFDCSSEPAEAAQ